MTANIVDGKNVVVTGAVAGESRATAAAKLRDAGAKIQSAVNSTTDLLVTGARVGPKKIADAEALGVKIVEWDAVWNGTRTARARPVERAQVRTVAPMLAKAGDLPTGPGWLYEVKWDGYRGIATVADGAVTIQSRSAKSDLAEQFPTIAAELAAFPNCVLDGELVVLDAAGDSAFEGLTGAGSAGAAARYVVFDLLELDGIDLRGYSLENRRSLLDGLLDEGLVRERSLVQLSPAFEDGTALLQVAAERGLEGIVAKPKTGRYLEGKRGPWLKIKLRCEQEFVVVGYTDGEGDRAGTAGSLALAICDDDGRYTYVGRVGSGGTYADMVRIVEQLQPVREWDIDTGTAKRAELDRVHWVVPSVVVQVRFQRWTEDGRLWHPTIQGQRIDKAPADVRREPCSVA